VEGVQNKPTVELAEQTPSPDQLAVLIEVDGQVPFAAAEADLGDVGDKYLQASGGMKAEQQIGPRTQPV
jgi:hypothetical protein